MKKNEIYQLGNSLGLNNKIIESIICKEMLIDRKHLFLLNHIDNKIYKQIEKSIYRAANGEPIEYIIEKAVFFSLDFYINNNVLIPRDETELLVKEAIYEINNYDKISLIDIGTGSGNIAISCTYNCISSISNSYALDISRKAIQVCSQNIKNYSLEKKIYPLKSNLLGAFLKANKYKLEKNIIILANLPYINSKDKKNISPITLNYEPKTALFGGNKTGFELYESLFNQILLLYKKYGPKNLIAFFEIGYDQYKISKEYFYNKNIKTKYYKDNNGIYRYIKIIF